MSIQLWRIALETTAYTARDMSGAAAQASHGRWNPPDASMVYCSENIALAVLGTLGHIRFGRLPYNRFLVRIDVPNLTWARRQVLNPLPAGWDAIPYGVTSQHIGADWIRSACSALLSVPSVIVPEERNILVNPAHPDASAILATTCRRWQYDPRHFAQMEH